MSQEGVEQIRQDDVWISPYLTAYARGADITPADIVMAGIIKTMRLYEPIMGIDAEPVLNHLETLPYNPTQKEQERQEWLDAGAPRPKPDEEYALWRSLSYHNNSVESLESGLAAVEAMSPDERAAFEARQYDDEVLRLQSYLDEEQERLSRMGVVAEAVAQWQPTDRAGEFTKEEVQNRLYKDSGYVRGGIAEYSSDLQGLQERSPKEVLDGKVRGATKRLHVLREAVEEDEVRKAAAEAKWVTEQATRIAKTQALIDDILASVEVPDVKSENE